MAPPGMLEVDLPDAQARVELVQELDRRDLHAAVAVDRNAVLVAVPRAVDGARSILEPLVALEAWLDRQESDEVRVRVDGRTYDVRSRDEAADAAPPSGADAHW